MKIALAQINPRLGDYAYNALKMRAAVDSAARQGAVMTAFPEMSLFGYPAYDLLEMPAEFEKQQKEQQSFLKTIPSKMTVVFGAVVKNPGKKGKPYQNVAVVARKNQKPLFAAKQLLPSYDVFEDTRFFEPGGKTLITKIEG